MPVVMTIPELERLLGEEFPQAFHPGSGLSIEALWEGGCRIRQAFREGSLRPGGTISGPTMMALADVAMYVALARRNRSGPAGRDHQSQHQFPAQARTLRSDGGGAAPEAGKAPRQRGGDASL